MFVGFGSLLRFCFFVTIPVSLFDTMVQEGAFLFFYCLTVAFGVESFCLFLSIVSIFDFILYVLLLLPDHLYTQYSTKCYYVRILNRSEGKIVPLYRSRLGPPPSQAPLLQRPAPFLTNTPTLLRMPSVLQNPRSHKDKFIHPLLNLQSIIEFMKGVLSFPFLRRHTTDFRP